MRFHGSLVVLFLAALALPRPAPACPLACVKEAAGLLRVELDALLSQGLPNTPMAGATVRVISGNFITARTVRSPYSRAIWARVEARFTTLQPGDILVRVDGRLSFGTLQFGGFAPAVGHHGGRRGHLARRVLRQPHQAHAAHARGLPSHRAHLLLVEADRLALRGEQHHVGAAVGERGADHRRARQGGARADRPACGP